MTNDVSEWFTVTTIGINNYLGYAPFIIAREVPGVGAGLNRRLGTGVTGAVLAVSQ